MSYKVSVFKNLREKYANVSELETYLKSADGGALRVVSGGLGANVLRYVKGSSNLKLDHVKWFRSVVWDNVNNRPLCVAPPKAEMTAVPTGTGESSKFTLVQDFLDGTMINVFRTFAEPDRLQLATRSTLGAGGKFYTNSTFEQMFNDALGAVGLNQKILLTLLPTPTEDVPSVFVSFLLQHPDHRVVARCHSPRVFAVHVGWVSSDATVTIDETLESTPSLFRFSLLSQPMTGFHSIDDLKSFFQGLVATKGWFWQGLTFKDGNGNRWRLRNPNYSYLRSLRGSEATNVERFLRLRSESKVGEYLKHYGEDRDAFWRMEERLRQATRDVYAAYCAVHKSRDFKLADVPKSVQPCVFRLHSHYLEHLKPNNEKVTMKDAVDLVNNMALFEQRRLMDNDTTLEDFADMPGLEIIDLQSQTQSQTQTPSEVPPVGAD